jgi:hypothetical protein
MRPSSEMRFKKCFKMSSEFMWWLVEVEVATSTMNHGGGGWLVGRGSEYPNPSPHPHSPFLCVRTTRVVRDVHAPLPALFLRALWVLVPPRMCRLHWQSVSSSSMILSSSLRTPAIVSRSTCHRSFLAVSCPFDASLLRCDRVLLFMLHLTVVIPRRIFLRNGCRSRASLR